MLPSYNTWGQFLLMLDNRFDHMSQTFSGKKKKRKKTHGYRARKKTKAGKKILKRRRRKGRKNLAK